MDSIPNCREIFSDELAKIHDSSIRDFVIEVFKLICPDYFWTVAASTTGKYHPLISIGKGGLIRHVKLAVWWGELYCLAYDDVTEEMTCQIIASLLIHDILKNGKELTPGGMPKHREITRTHGVDLAKELQKHKRKLVELSAISPRLFRRIFRGVGGHMGKWTDEKYEKYKPSELTNKQDRRVAEIVHLADFTSAQKIDSFMDNLKENW